MPLKLINLRLILLFLFMYHFWKMDWAIAADGQSKLFFNFVVMHFLLISYFCQNWSVLRNMHLLKLFFQKLWFFFFSNLYLLEENIYTYMKSGYRNQHRIMVVNFMPHAIFRSCHQISILILLSATTVVIFCLNSWDKFSLFTFGGGDYCPLCDHILIRNLLLVTRIDIHLLKAGEHNRWNVITKMVGGQ